MTASDTPPPLTDEEMEAIRALWSDIRAARTEKTSIGEMVPVDIDLFDAKLPKVFAEVDRLRAEAERHARDRNAYVKKTVQRYYDAVAERDALAAKAKQAWSEGHSAALAAGCDQEDQFRTNLGVLLVAEEQRCQMAINENPLDPHLLGRLTGLQRARDIVTGDAFPAALGETGGTDG
jgi:hypothetical protein